jgi:hypothetical protein
MSKTYGLNILLDENKYYNLYNVSTMCVHDFYKLDRAYGCL